CLKSQLSQLERKYKTEDVGTKKFVVAHFLDYKMVDSKNMISQVQDLQVEFKIYLKHKPKKMSVEDLVVRLRIKEDNKLAQKDTYTSDSTKANMVEHVGSSSRSNSKGKTKTKGRMTRRAKGSHRAANYKMPKRVNPHHENMVNDNMDMIAMVSDFVAMISEVNLVGSNNSGWWVDNGTTCHVCADKSMFHSLKEVDHGEKLYMGNSVNSDIKGDGMFKLNVMVVMNDINKMNSSAYLIKSSNMWYGRLGHVTNIAQKDKNEAKQIKPGMGMKRVQEIEAKGEFILSLNQIQSH
ncbi:hypothetical protein Tco_0809236, partial [Tanacetum coccineum]